MIMTPIRRLSYLHLPHSLKNIWQTPCHVTYRDVTSQWSHDDVANFGDMWRQYDIIGWGHLMMMMIFFASFGWTQPPPVIFRVWWWIYEAFTLRNCVTFQSAREWQISACDYDIVSFLKTGILASQGKKSKREVKKSLIGHQKRISRLYKLHV